MHTNIWHPNLLLFWPKDSSPSIKKGSRTQLLESKKTQNKTANSWAPAISPSTNPDPRVPGHCSRAIYSTDIHGIDILSLHLSHCHSFRQSRLDASNNALTENLAKCTPRQTNKHCAKVLGSQWKCLRLFIWIARKASTHLSSFEGGSRVQ